MKELNELFSALWARWLNYCSVIQPKLLFHVVGRLDLMATTKTAKSADPNSTYLKAAEVYDDGSIKAKYYAEAIREDEGIRPPD